MHRIAHDEMRRNHDSGVFRVEREGAFLFTDSLRIHVFLE